MDTLPNDVFEYILTKLSSVKDLASCKCVSKKWKDSKTYLKSLSFPDDIFHNLKNGQTPDDVVTQMLSSNSRLEELLVHCSFTSDGLASWMLLVGSSLKILDLRVDNRNLECIQVARNLESLRLLNVFMVHDPKWDAFQKLHSLEISGEDMEDWALTVALRATPNLTKLVLGHCEGSRTIRIEHLKLQHCEFISDGGSELELRAPKIQYLQIEGCKLITVHEANCLKNLSINSDFGFRTRVDFGKLMALETLYLGGCRWNPLAIRKMLQLASEVKHLYMENKYIVHKSDLRPFYKIDFVDFFNSHPKLEALNIHGPMFTGLSQRNSLQNVESSFVIPCLEEAMITLVWPFNAKQKMSTIESMLKYGKKLKKMKIEILLTQIARKTALDDILEEINRTLIRVSSCSSLRFRLFRHSTTELHLIHTRQIEKVQEEDMNRWTKETSGSC